MPRKKSSAKSSGRLTLVPPDAPPEGLQGQQEAATATVEGAPTPAIELVAQPHGGFLQRGGTPGNRGGGRPKNEFKAMCRELASADEVYLTVAMILENPFKFEALYLGALKWATEQGYGKATETIENNTTVTVKQEWTFGAKKVSF